MTKMRKTRFILAALLLTSLPAAAGTQDVLHTFADNGDGGFPISGLARDTHGNLFGTTDLGGPGTCGAGCGNVFEIAHDGMFSVLHTFQGSLSDGGNPQAAPVLDTKGNLFGATVTGGAKGCGVVYELSPTKRGGWHETILHDFDPSKGDGCNPYAMLVFDSAGNLYGTTNKGGGGGVNGTFCENGCGAVFALSPSAGGRWKETILHSFPGTKGSTDGQNPYGGVVIDSKGNLWGTTQAGGTGGTTCNPFGTPPGCGTVFELSQTAHGKWKEKLVYSFQDFQTGWYPYAGLAIDARDNLYSALVNGADNGMIVKLTPKQGGLSESLVYAFAPCDEQQGCLDGVHPFGGVTFGRDGSLYGTTVQGGAAGFACGETDNRQPVGCGTVFKLTPNGDGPWHETILLRFSGGADGASPGPDVLAVDAKGRVYGTAPDGGDLADCPGEVGCGVVFRLKP